MACLNVENYVDFVNREIEYKGGGVLTEELIRLFKSTADETGLSDWRYLAALSQTESSWNSTITNSKGYHGLFQYLQRNMCTNRNVNVPKDQTYCASINMISSMEFARKKGMDAKNQFMYATIVHNVGEEGTQVLLKEAKTKDINGILNVEHNGRNRSEVINHPLRCWKNYQDICTKYSK